MPTTYDSIATTTLGSAASSYTFSSIPSSYTNLVLTANGSTVGGTENFRLRFNSDTGTNYLQIRYIGDGTTASMETQASQTGAAVADWGSDRCSLFVTIPGYSGTNFFKTMLSRFGAENYVGMYASTWRSTAAINSITIYKNSGANITAGTTFTLYGILSA